MEQFQYLIELSEKVMSSHRPEHLDSETNMSQSVEYSTPLATPQDTILLISLKEFYPYFKQQHP